jgi:thioredoxin 1
MTESKINQNVDVAEETVVGEAKPNKNSLLLKILLIAAILIAIAAIWFAKNGSVTKITADHAAEATQTAESGESATAEDQADDFALEADAIDLAALFAYKLPIIIDFGSDSCIPCQEMAPVLISANEDYRGKAIIKFVDVWKHTDAANNFPVQVIPTQIFFNADGTPYVPSDDLGIEFGFYRMKDTQKHVFTVHQGGLTEEQMRNILADMGAGE